MLNPPCLLFRVNKHVKQKGMAAHKQIKTTKMHSSGSTPLQGCNRHHHTRINGLTDSIHPRKVTNVTWEKGTILEGKESSEPTIHFQRDDMFLVFSPPFPVGFCWATKLPFGQKVFASPRRCWGGPKLGVELGHVGLAAGFGTWTLNESMHFFIEEWCVFQAGYVSYQWGNEISRNEIKLL